MLRVPITEDGWRDIHNKARAFGIGTHHIAQLELRDDTTIIYHHSDGVKESFFHATLMYDKINSVIEFRRSHDRRARPILDTYSFFQALFPALRTA